MMTQVSFINDTDLHADLMELQTANEALISLFDLKPDEQYFYDDKDELRFK